VIEAKLGVLGVELLHQRSSTPGRPCIPDVGEHAAVPPYSGWPLGDQPSYGLFCVFLLQLLLLQRSSCVWRLLCTTVSRSLVFLLPGILSLFAHCHLYGLARRHFKTCRPGRL